LSKLIYVALFKVKLAPVSHWLRFTLLPL